MRIVSLLPAATEIACALGLQDSLVGISFECDYPAAITHLPRVVSTAIDTRALTPRDIDAQVTALMKEGKSLYLINEELLKELRPDIILTQNLCQVCAPSGNELSHALEKLDYKPQVIFMSPHSLADIEGNIAELAAATGRKKQAKELLFEWRLRIEAVQKRTDKMRRFPRVMVMEWVDPIYCAGHWLAEMVEIAGGQDVLSRKGEDSVRIGWNEVLEWQPEVIIVAPCGYNKAQAEEQMKLLYGLPGWESVPAVRHRRVHAVDANAYLVRPGPRLADGLEMLADLFAVPAPDARKAASIGDAIRG